MDFLQYECSPSSMFTDAWLCGHVSSEIVNQVRSFLNRHVVLLDSRVTFLGDSTSESVLGLGPTLCLSATNKDPRYSRRPAKTHDDSDSGGKHDTNTKVRGLRSEDRWQMWSLA